MLLWAVLPMLLPHSWSSSFWWLRCTRRQSLHHLPEGLLCRSGKQCGNCLKEAGSMEGWKLLFSHFTEKSEANSWPKIRLPLSYAWWFPFLASVSRTLHIHFTHTLDLNSLSQGVCLREDTHLDQQFQSDQNHYGTLKWLFEIELFETEMFYWLFLYC